MKREFLENLGLEKEMIDKIMDENGKDINAEKAKATAKDDEIKALKEQMESLGVIFEKTCIFRCVCPDAY